MSYFLYQLQFDTPVHFGTAETGGKLEQANLAYHADTLFSALCCELAEQGAEEDLQDFIANTKQGKIRFSDLFPWHEENSDVFYYVPKPIFPAMKPIVAFHSLQERIFYQSQRKKMSQVSYLRASQLQAYLSAQQKGSAFPVTPQSFGKMQINERVNCRQEGDNLPYFVKSFVFAPNAGLYGIVYVADDDLWYQIEVALESLGLTGIGGKRSSGYGKFHFYDDAYDLQAPVYDDDQVLSDFIGNKTASCQICLATLLPKAEEIRDLEGGYYHLLRRSGFITNAMTQQKRDSVYMLSPGSCLSKRLQGMIGVVGQDAGHEVLRYGLGMYAGVTL